LFEVYKKYFIRIQASSIFRWKRAVDNPECLRYESDSNASYHGNLPRYYDRYTPLEGCGEYIKDAVKGLLPRIEKAKSNLKALERRAASIAVRKAQVAAVLGTTRNLAATIKNDLPLDHPCPYCEEDLGPDFHADHIYPVSKGGQSRAENMVNVCAQCNTEKSDLTLVRFIELKGLNRERIERNLNSLGKEF
jgi:5-methylcytosine-specific restriction endonuclease McrA